MNNSKQVEHFDETIYEEYENEKMELITPTDPGTTYRDNTKLENKTNYFDPLSKAKSPLIKKASTSNRFQIMPKKVDTNFETNTSLNSKTKLKPVFSQNNKMTKSMKNSTDDMIATKNEIIQKNIANKNDANSHNRTNGHLIEPNNVHMKRVNSKKILDEKSSKFPFENSFRPIELKFLLEDSRFTDRLHQKSNIKITCTEKRCMGSLLHSEKFKNYQKSKEHIIEQASDFINQFYASVNRFSFLLKYVCVFFIEIF